MFSTFATAEARIQEALFLYEYPSTYNPYRLYPYPIKYIIREEKLAKLLDNEMVETLQNPSTLIVKNIDTNVPPQVIFDIFLTIAPISHFTLIPQNGIANSRFASSQNVAIVRYSIGPTWSRTAFDVFQGLRINGKPITVLPARNSKTFYCKMTVSLFGLDNHVDPNYLVRQIERELKDCHVLQLSCLRYLVDPETPEEEEDESLRERFVYRVALSSVDYAITLARREYLVLCSKLVRARLSECCYYFLSKKLNFIYNENELKSLTEDQNDIRFVNLNSFLEKKTKVANTKPETPIEINSDDITSEEEYSSNEANGFQEHRISHENNSFKGSFGTDHNQGQHRTSMNLDNEEKSSGSSGGGRRRVGIAYPSTQDSSTFSKTRWEKKQEINYRPLMEMLNDSQDSDASSNPIQFITLEPFEKKRRENQDFEELKPEGAQESKGENEGFLEPGEISLGDLNKRKKNQIWEFENQKKTKEISSDSSSPSQCSFLNNFDGKASAEDKKASSNGEDLDKSMMQKGMFNKPANSFFEEKKEQNSKEWTALRPLDLAESRRAQRKKIRTGELNIDSMSVIQIDVSD